MPSNFYNQIYAEGYDADDQRQPVVAFYLCQWEQAGKPSPLLEPMCGTGFFLIAFLEAGADIDGLEENSARQGRLNSMLMIGSMARQFFRPRYGATAKTAV